MPDIRLTLLSALILSLLSAFLGAAIPSPHQAHNLALDDRPILDARSYNLIEARGRNSADRGGKRSSDHWDAIKKQIGRQRLHAGTRPVSTHYSQKKAGSFYNTKVSSKWSLPKGSPVLVLQDQPKGPTEVGLVITDPQASGESGLVDGNLFNFQFKDEEGVLRPARFELLKIQHSQFEQRRYDIPEWERTLAMTLLGMLRMAHNGASCDTTMEGIIEEPGKAETGGWPRADEAMGGVTVEKGDELSNAMKKLSV